MCLASLGLAVCSLVRGCVCVSAGKFLVLRTWTWESLESQEYLMMRLLMMARNVPVNV